MINNSIKEALNKASNQLLSLHPDKRDATFEAHYLLQEMLQVNRAWLISHEEDDLSAELLDQFESQIARRIQGEPIAYILGYREFYGLKLKVNAATLIPRPDTETLVEAALARIPHDASFNILDLGTGSGAIALAIAKNRPLASIVAVDFSQAALSVAEENAQNLKITNISFIASHWFSALKETRFNVIVSNPPYIEDQDAHLTMGDLRFEPLSALASGQDGLDDIRKIIQGAKTHLKPNGWLMLEHGYNQASAVANLLKLDGYQTISHTQDLAGIQRVTLGRI